MKQEEYCRDSCIGEIIQLDESQYISTRIEFPYKFGESSNKDLFNMNMMTEADAKNIILVRGYKIQYQLQEK